jgi:hypothetical protein
MISQRQLERVKNYLTRKASFERAKSELESAQAQLEETFRNDKLPRKFVYDNQLVIIARNKAAKMIQVHTTAIDGVYKDGNQITVHSNPLEPTFLEHRGR